MLRVVFLSAVISTLHPQNDNENQLLAEFPGYCLPTVVFWFFFFNSFLDSVSGEFDT